MNDLTRLMRYARPHVAALSLGILLTSIVGLFEAARIALVSPIIDGLSDASKVNSHQVLSDYLPAGISLWTAIAGLLVLFTLLKGVAFFCSSYLLTGVGQQIIVHLRQELYDHILRQSAPFFNSHRSTELSTHIISDVERVQHAVTVLIAETLRESFTLVALLIYAFMINWRLATFSLVNLCPHGSLWSQVTTHFASHPRRYSRSARHRAGIDCRQPHCESFWHGAFRRLAFSCRAHTLAANQYAHGARSLSVIADH
jgi:ABC-type multidrug transport system fused ATPase/permease subunit